MHASERQTDGRTEFSSLYRVCITCSAVKPGIRGLGATYDVHLRLIGKRVVDFPSVLVELFR